MINSKNNLDVPKPPAGTYAPTVARYTSTVVYKNLIYKFTFSKGVRGFNIPDIDTIRKDGSMFSRVLGA